MEFTPSKINLFTLIKLPSAFLTGVRLKSISNEESVVSVKHRWINQNPFKSMFWAVQGMAAELSTGIMVMKQIKESNQNISMLVVNMNANFSKKAKGKILFMCKDGALIKEKIEKAIQTKEGQTFILTSKGIDQNGDEVSSFDFKWSIKLK